MLDLLLMFFTNLKEDEQLLLKKVNLNIDVDLVDQNLVGETDIDVTELLT